MPDNSNHTNNINNEERKGELAQNKKIKSRGNDSHQHQFVSSTPITSFNIFQNDAPFRISLKGSNPMSVTKCESCGTKFISVLEYGSNRIMRRKSSFDCNFAALYNTEQLGGRETGNS